MEIIVSKRSGNVLVYIPELKKRVSLDSSTFLWVGKKTYEFVNVCDDNKTAFGSNT